MTDIVERLRDYDPTRANSHEAADEIERLRALAEIRMQAVRELRAEIERWKYQEGLAIERCKELETDIERLTAQLMQYADAETTIRDLRAEVERLQAEVATWRDRYEAERRDHEALIKAWDREKSDF
jgi:hypothetical protein